MTMPLCERLKSLRSLPFGWDGYNGIPVTKHAAETAQELLNLVTVGSIVPQVVPSAAGGVQLEWHHPLLTLELYIPSSGYRPCDSLSAQEIEGMRSEAEEQGVVRTWCEDTL